MDFTISRRLSSGRLYAYYKKRFWFWDDTRNVWTESHLMSQKYEREHSARAALTPEDFMSDLTRFSPLDEYELDSVMVDALKNAIPCKTVPIEPVKEESECPVSIPEASPQSSELAPAGHVDSTSATPSALPIQANAAGALQGALPTAPSFDFGADDETNALLLQDAQTFITGNMARIMAAKHAHDLCANHYKGTWGKWCAAVGISRDTGENMVRVAEQFGNIQLEGKSILDVQPMKLLYAAAKPSTPEEVKEAVFSGDITTYKEYQELMAQLKAKETELSETNARAQEAESHYEAALSDLNGLTEKNAQLKAQVDAAEAERDKLLGAQNRAAWAESHIQDVEAQRDAALADVQGLTEQNAKLQQSYHDADESRIAANLQRQKAEAERDRAEQRAKTAEEALKKQPITAVIDEEEIDRRAAEKACGLADARNAELAKDNANLKKQVAALRSRINDDAQADFEQANYCASLMQAAWDNSKASYSRLAGEDLESTFQTICGTLNSIMEEASLLCRQPSDHDGGDRDE